jgi:hypothetical protein
MLSYLFCGSPIINLCYLYWFTYTGVQPDFNITCCSSRLPITWQVPQVKKKNGPFMSSTPIFLWVHVTESLVFCAYFCRLVFVSLSLLWPLYCLSCDFHVFNALIIETYWWMAYKLRYVCQFDMILLPRCKMDKMKSWLIIRLSPNLSLCVLTSESKCYLSFS